MLFRGYRVGSVETSYFDPKERAMRYQLFITAPYDQLVTTNVRFWKDSGVAFDMSAQGMRVEMGSLTTLFSGGVSFDVPDGWDRGEPAKERRSTSCSTTSAARRIRCIPCIRITCCSSPIRYAACSRAPRSSSAASAGTVAQVPFYKDGMAQRTDNDYRIPVLIRIEPDRLHKQLGTTSI